MPSSPGTSTLPQNFIPWTPHEIWLYTKINLQLQLYWSRGPPHLFRQEIHSEPKNLGVETPYFGPQLFLKIWICKAESYPFWLYILPGMFLRVRNPEIMVRKSENEGKHLFWDHFCVVVAMVCLGQKFTVWKKNCNALQEISFGILKWHRMKPFYKMSWHLWYSDDIFPRNWKFFTKFSC